MKNLFTLVMVLFCAITTTAQISYERNLEGDCVRVQDEATSGYVMAETLSSDGTRIEQIAYKWFSGYAESDNKQMAIEMAQREAFNTVSRTFNNAVLSAAVGVTNDVNGRAVDAVTSCWVQVSNQIVRGCEPFGENRIEYNRNTGKYKVTAKIAMRGDIYKKIIDNIKNNIPRNLSDSEMDIFMSIHTRVVDVVR